jgi:hypothetical protein
VLIFKGIRWVLIPIGISVTGALTMTGILAFLGWKVTVISSNFFSLLLVMTISVTIHLIVRYRELAQNNRSVLNFGTCAFGKKRIIIGKATNDSTKAMVTPIDIIQPKSITGLIPLISNHCLSAVICCLPDYYAFFTKSTGTKIQH